MRLPSLLTKGASLVIDIYHLQKNIEPRILAEAGVKLVIAKASQGIWKDTGFLSLSERVKGFLPLGAYLFVDPLVSPEENIRVFSEQVKAARSPVKLIMLDIEQWWADHIKWTAAITRSIPWSEVPRLPPEKISEHAKKVFELSKTLEIPVCVYTSYGFVTSYAMPIKDWLGQCDLVAAHYGSRPGGKMQMGWEEFKAKWLPSYNPLVPPGTNESRFIGHQFMADTIMLPGVRDRFNEPVALDVNLFRNDYLESILKEKISEVEQPPTVKRLFKVVNCSALNVRSGPGTTYSIIKTVKVGTQLPAVEQKGAWWKVVINGKLGWVHSLYLYEIKSGPAAPRKYTVANCSALNIRRGPGMNYPILKTVSAGTVLLEAEGNQGTWIKVLYGTETGWVSQYFIKEVA